MKQVMRLFASWLIIIFACALIVAPLYAQEATAEPPVVEPPVVVVETPPSGVPDTLFLIVVVVLAVVPLVDKYLTSGAGKEAVTQLGASAPKWVTDAMFNLASERIAAGKERARLTPDPLDDVSVEELERQVLELRRQIDAKRAGATYTPQRE